EELRELGGIDLEVVAVLGVRLRPDRRHALVDTATECRALVAREVEPAHVVQEVEQRLEPSGVVVDRGRHQSSRAGARCPAFSSTSRSRLACSSASRARSSKRSRVLPCERRPTRRKRSLRSSRARSAAQSELSRDCPCASTRLSAEYA